MARTKDRDILSDNNERKQKEEWKYAPLTQSISRRMQRQVVLMVFVIGIKGTIDEDTWKENMATLGVADGREEIITQVMQENHKQQHGLFRMRLWQARSRVSQRLQHAEKIS
eukprot:760267-Hanusia_phi.AAC.8